MVRIALFNYPLALAIFAASCLVAAAVWQGLFHVVPEPPRYRYAHFVLLLLALFPMLVVARGGVGGKPISVGDAFFLGQAAQGHLALSGAFAISRAILESPPPSQHFMPDAEAIEAVQLRLSGGDRSLFHTADYPLQRSFHSAPPKTPPNVVVLMLESWGAQHIDALRTLKGGSTLGATPNFDSLAARGRLYSRAYGNGQRSIQGASAILASQPTLYGMPFLGEGLEQNQLSFLGEIARSQGYQTFFLQSSEGASLRFDAIAARAGFDHYQGAEDIRNLHPHPKPPATWGTWDHNTLQAAHAQFAAAKKPFLGFVFTSTTHVPWMVPEERFNKFNVHADVDAFHNSLFYADWALGQLIAAAKTAGYYDNTIFVLAADHADEFVENASDIPNQYHIPLLFVGPGVSPGVDDRIASQLDILPTLIDLCGWRVDFAGWGRSLLGPNQPQNRASFGIRGTEVDWITADGWLSHNLEISTGRSPGLPTQQAAVMQKNLLATYQMASQLQRTNRVLHRP
jgi:phosphoglycerol transferase MdoB-like AlkP superfamily enzyme